MKRLAPQSREGWILSEEATGKEEGSRGERRMTRCFERMLLMSGGNRGLMTMGPRRFLMGVVAVKVVRGRRIGERMGMMYLYRLRGGRSRALTSGFCISGVQKVYLFGL